MVWTADKILPPTQGLSRPSSETNMPTVGSQLSTKALKDAHGGMQTERVPLTSDGPHKHPKSTIWFLLASISPSHMVPQLLP